MLFIASLFVYNSSIRPAYSEVSALRTEVANRTDIINTNKASVQQVQKLLSEYQNAASIQETTSLVLPLEQNLYQEINQFNGLARISGLSLDNLSVKELAIKPSSQPNLVSGIGTLRFTVHLTGTYAGLKSFLQMAETNINLMNLVNLKIEPTRSASVFSFTIDVDTYYQS